MVIQARTLKLPNNFINILVNLPETSIYAFNILSFLWINVLILRKKFEFFL